MVEVERKEVTISNQFNLDIISLYTFGEEVFGAIAAKSFIADIYSRVWSLDSMYLLHVECRHLPTSDKRYRNIIVGFCLLLPIKKGLCPHPDTVNYEKGFTS